MSKTKKYFENIDANICYNLDYHIQNAKVEEFTQITLVEAIPDNEMSGYYWCSELENVVESIECKKSECPYYNSKSGIGVCKFRGKLYLHGEEVTFDVETKQQITKV